jgi:lysozyme
MARRINQAGLDLIKSYEGCRLVAYRDAVGVLTIGYGSTGAHVYPGKRITQQQAEDLLRQDLSRFELGVNAQVAGAPTTDNQFAAMVSLAFNIGLGGFAKSSVLRNHKLQRYNIASASFLLWNKAKGRILAGLTRRRNAERKLYLTK